MKKTISESEYYQLQGAYLLARHHNKALEELEKAACALLGIKDPDNTCGPAGHISDLIYSPDSWDADEILRILKITVREGRKK